MISVSWYDAQKSILYQQFTGEWTWEEYDEAFEKGVAMIGSVEHRVDVIVHIVAEAAIKLSPGAIERWRSDLFAVPENMGSLVEVSQSAFFVTLIEAFASILDATMIGKLHRVDTLPDAEAHIRFLRSG